MSRLIKKPIAITAGATLVQSGDVLTIKGPKGELTITLPTGVEVKTEGTNFWVTTTKDMQTTALQGTVWSLAKNAIEGVTIGFTKVLELEGVGYRVSVEGKELVLFLGYALPVRMPIPDTVTVAVDKNTIKVTGIDKDAVGQVAADIRAQKKPEPYKGKGIRYEGEVVRMKQGKKAATAAA